jgi:hypothetical protein
MQEQRVRGMLSVPRISLWLREIFDVKACVTQQGKVAKKPTADCAGKTNYKITGQVRCMHVWGVMYGV